MSRRPPRKVASGFFEVVNADYLIPGIISARLIQKKQNSMRSLAQR